MQLLSRIVLTIAVVASFFAFAERADAVILARTATRNTNAPGNGLLNSGWQWEGNYGSFLGTPIAPNYFITAEHIGGGVGSKLTLNGKTYTTTAMYDDPSTDLRIFKVSTPFSSYAPLLTSTSETGKMMSVYGRGTQRGAAFNYNNQLKGWKWGASDGVKSWGRNAVAGIANGGAGRGELLKFSFNRTGGDYYEAALSDGDSAGGVFLKDTDGKWKLAGINFLVEGPFSTSGANGTGFNASMVDKGGLYYGGNNAWMHAAESSIDNPGNWYATRISTRVSWIKSITGNIPGTVSGASLAGVTAVPEPASLGAISLAATMLLRRRPRRRA